MGCMGVGVLVCEYVCVCVCVYVCMDGVGVWVSWLCGYMVCGYVNGVGVCF